MAQCDIGLTGAGVMGQNFALNIADHAFSVALHSRSPDKVVEFVRKPHPFPPGGGLEASRDLPHFVSLLSRPRKIILLVPAGKPTDDSIEALAPLLAPGDVLIDCGNAHWLDTARRETRLRERSIRFIGSGISGGAEGARFGPSLMPGGDREAYSLIEPIWNAVAAKVDPRTGREILGGAPGRPVDAREAEPCSAYIGPAGSGHFVKMVHNGIEYADMQLIAEAFHLLRSLAGIEPAHASDIFSRWNEGELDSYLVQITAEVLRQRDPRTGRPFVDAVLDAAGQKGTGKWTSVAALDMGVTAPTIAEAVFARCLSALKPERVEASRVLAGPRAEPAPSGVERDELVESIRHALYASKVAAYAQGFQLLASASSEWGWGLDLGRLAMIWRGGCIIRARLLQRIHDAFRTRRDLPNLMLDPSFSASLRDAQPGWRETLARATRQGLPAPAFASALAYYDGYRSAILPASLIQAQRDYFGAHTYERVDEPRGRFFHLSWFEPGRPETTP